MNIRQFCDTPVYFFALWTIAYHVTFAVRGDTYQLMLIFLMFGVSALLIACRLPKISHKLSPLKECSSFPHIVAFIGVVLVLCIHRSDIDDCFHLSTALISRNSPQLPVASVSRLMFGEPNFYWLPQSWRLQSLDTFVGTVSLLAGIQPIYVAHFFIPTVAILFTIYSLYLLFSELSPQYRHYLLACSVLFLLAAGSTFVSIGNLGGFARLHHGNGIFLTGVIPFIAYCTICYCRSPNLHGLLRLNAIQIAASGLSSTALVVGPCVLLISALSVTPSLKCKLTTVLTCLASAIYPVVLALIMMAFLNDASSTLTYSNQNLMPSYELKKFVLFVIGPSPFLSSCIVLMILGFVVSPNTLSRNFCVGSLCLTILLFYNPISFQLITSHVLPASIYYRMVFIAQIPVLVSFGLVALLQLVETRKLLAATILSSLIFIFPLVHKLQGHELGLERLSFLSVNYFVVVAFLLLLVFFNRQRYLLQQILFVSFLGLFYLLTPYRHVLDSSNNLSSGTFSFGLPKLKIPEVHYQTALALKELVSENEPVVTNSFVGAWLPTISGAPLPILARLNHLPSVAKVMSKAELDLREQLSLLMHNWEQRDNPEELISKAVERFGPKAFAIYEGSRYKQKNPILKKFGFELARTTKRYEIWLHRKNE